MSKTFIRAKSEENKQIKLLEIMNVTDELFKENTYHDITLTTISKALNIARGGLYKYVSSKEEIFLLIYLKKQKEVIDEINSQITVDTSKDQLVNIMSNTLYKHIDYIKYHQILNAIIETNVTIERLADFKVTSYNDREELFNKILSIVQLNNIQEVTHLYLMILYHCVYLSDRYAYEESYRLAMQLANLPIEEIDFVSYLNQFITICFNNYYKS